MHVNWTLKVEMFTTSRGFFVVSKHSDPEPKLQMQDFRKKDSLKLHEVHPTKKKLDVDMLFQP